MLLTLVTILAFESLLGFVACQEGKRDDTHVENVVRQAVADEFSSEIITNKTRAYLSCASGEMVIKMNFTEPFRGVTYTDYDRTGPCKFYGDGRQYYELRIPLKGCGTKQEAPRVFINNIIVRFHRSLELEEDEIKTIICRYPPPLAPVPPPIVAPLPTAAVPVIVPPKLSEVELLLIICALLFLTLLLLGIGVAYYCLKKRNIKVIKKRKAISSGPGSAITKLSGSTMGTLSMFDPIRIPRATAQSTSGSEAALLTSVSSQNSTIPSDYPSESPSSVGSDVEEIDHGRRMMVSDVSTMRGDHFRYENTAFVPDEASSEASGYPEDRERADSVSSVAVQQVLKPFEPPKRKLKTKVAREQVLTTISEREDAALHREAVQRSYAAVRPVPDELQAPARYAQPYVREAPSPYAPSLYGSIPDNDDRSQGELIEGAPMASPPPTPSYAPSLKGSIPDNDVWSHSELESEVAAVPYVRRPKRETATVTDYFVTARDETEVEDEVSRLRKTTTLQHVKPPEPLAIVPKKPKIVVQNIDDVFLTTTTEVHATETVTKTTKDTVAQLVKATPTPPRSPPDFDVTIRHHPGQAPADRPHGEGDDKLSDRRWETFSEVSEKFRDAESTTTELPPRRRRHPSEPSRPTSPRPPSPTFSTLHRTTKDLPPPSYTNVVFKILDPPPVEGVECLTPRVQERWQTIISTDETFRSLVQESTTIEEYIRITKDSRYERLFDTRTWNVIIRVLSTPDDRYPLPGPPSAEPPGTGVVDARNPRYRKRSEFEPPRNRRSSLPPVTEFSLARDGNSNNNPPSVSGSVRSRRTSRSGDYDLRSMTEIDVDFARAVAEDRESLWSCDTGTTYRTSRSLAERSTSEFLEDVPTIEAEPGRFRDYQQTPDQRSRFDTDHQLQQQSRFDTDHQLQQQSRFDTDHQLQHQQSRFDTDHQLQQQQSRFDTDLQLHQQRQSRFDADYQQQQQSRYLVEQQASSSSHSARQFEEYSGGNAASSTRPRFLERSSAEYFEDVPVLSAPGLLQGTSSSERRLDHVARSEQFVRSEVVLDSSVRNSREEAKSLTETSVRDWKR